MDLDVSPQYPQVLHGYYIGTAELVLLFTYARSHIYMLSRVILHVAPAF